VPRARSTPAPRTGRSRNDISIKALTASLLLGAQLVSLLPAPATADDADITAGMPNILLIVDTSAHMAHSAPTNAYLSTKKYPVQRKCESPSGNGRTAVKQPCAADAVFKGRAYAHYADSLSDVTANDSASARMALADSGYWSGSLHGVNVTLYTGNYLNYLFAGCASGGACPKPKLSSAKKAVSAIVDANQGVRFGILALHHEAPSGRGGRVAAPIGSGVPALKSALTALTVGRGAALGEALYDAGQYFKGEPLTNGTRFPTPIQLGCQPNHVILITDAVQTTGARSLTGEAALRKQQDHSTSLADVQHVTVHVIGFGTGDSTSASGLDPALSHLQQVADNGGGAYFKADTASDLDASLRAALARITETTYSFTSPLMPAGSRRAYLASFQPAAATPFWRGSLKAYQRDQTGTVPVDDKGVPLASALAWDAAAALNRLPAGRRTIYTEIDGTLTPFAKTNGAITSAMLGVSSLAERNRVIDFVRGADANAQVRAHRSVADRPWKLGAIVRSTPVLVSAPVLALNDASYRAFKSAHAKRTKVVIVGADDGMLHAFRETDGVELWAFIPRDMLGRLPALAAVTGAHASFVDASPVAVDIKVAGTWRTIVVFGGGRGSRYYYALDVTDTTKPTFLWSFSDPKIQESWSEPAIGRVKLGNTDRYVAFVGGGHSASGTFEGEAHGKALFALDLAAGTKLWEYARTPAATDDRRYMSFSIQANPTAVDIDNDGYLDRVYVGDIGGQLWKFDVTAAETSRWTGKRLFASHSAGNRGGHSIDTAPALALDHRRNLWVFFGTTARHQDANPSNRFYGLRDDADMTNASALGDDSPGIDDVAAAGVTATRGWSIVLAGRGERPVGAANVFNGSVFFSTVAPDRGGGCGPDGGTAKLYAVGAWTGHAAIDFATGVAVTSPSASTPRAKEIGRGVASMPIVVVAPPIIPGATATASVTVATSNQELRSSAIPAPSFLKHLMSWRERMP
jgi:type IV pilus assembly protein PilY1